METAALCQVVGISFKLPWARISYLQGVAPHSSDQEFASTSAEFNTGCPHLLSPRCLLSGSQRAAIPACHGHLYVSTASIWGEANTPWDAATHCDYYGSLTNSLCLKTCSLQEWCCSWVAHRRNIVVLSCIGKEQRSVLER